MYSAQQNPNAQSLLAELGLLGPTTEVAKSVGEVRLQRIAKYSARKDTNSQSLLMKLGLLGLVRATRSEQPQKQPQSLVAGIASTVPRQNPNRRVQAEHGDKSRRLRVLGQQLGLRAGKKSSSMNAASDVDLLNKCGILFMAWAGLGFADAQRTCSPSLLPDRHVLRGECWRIKAIWCPCFWFFLDDLQAGVGAMCTSMRFAIGTPRWWTCSSEPSTHRRCKTLERTRCTALKPPCTRTPQG